MSAAAYHQVLPIAEPGAVTAHALALRDALRRAGHDSEIFAPLLHPASSQWSVYGLDDHRRFARPDDRIVYQLAIGSHAADFVLARAEPLVVNSHNLTPPRWFSGWDEVAAHGVAWGRGQMHSLASRASLGVGVSRFNEAELVEAGFVRTVTVPYLLDLDAFAVEPDAALLERLEATRHASEWLFVGRLAPNKAQHDLVKAFHAFRRTVEPDARLHLVGGGTEGTYGDALQAFVGALGLDDRVVCTGAVPPTHLAAHYAAADVFVSASEHEGFCVPLLEAWYHRLPVVAYRAAAVPETLADAGLLLDCKDAATVAAAVARVTRDGTLRDRLVATGTARLARFDVSITGPEMVAALETV